MLLKELIPFLDINRKDIKLHLARGAKVKEEALVVFLNGGFKEWQEYQNNKNFGRNYILSLIRLGNWEWLFGGIYKVKGYKETRDGHYIYNTQLTEFGEDLIGKVIVHFKRDFRQSYCCLENYIDEIDLVEIVFKVQH